MSWKLCCWQDRTKHLNVTANVFAKNHQGDGESFDCKRAEALQLIKSVMNFLLRDNILPTIFWHTRWSSRGLHQDISYTVILRTFSFSYLWTLYLRSVHLYGPYLLGPVPMQFDTKVDTTLHVFRKSYIPMHSQQKKHCTKPNPEKSPHLSGCSSIPHVDIRRSQSGDVSLPIWRWEDSKRFSTKVSKRMFLGNFLD